MYFVIFSARSNSNSMSKIDVVDENEQILTKPDIVLSFTVEVNN